MSNYIRHEKILLHFRMRVAEIIEKATYEIDIEARDNEYDESMLRVCDRNDIHEIITETLQMAMNDLDDKWDALIAEDVGISEMLAERQAA